MIGNLRFGKGMKHKLLAFLLILFMALSSAPGQEEKSASPEKRLNSLQKSLLLPGWGQLAEKRYAEGVLFLAAEAFSLYEILSYNHKGNWHYDRYKRADSREEAVRYRGLTEKYDRRRNAFILAAAGIWAANLVDIYVIVKKKENTKKALRLSLEQGGIEKLAVHFSLNF